MIILNATHITMPDSYNPSRPSDQAGTQAITLPVSESSNAFTAGADTTRDPDLPQTQSPPTTASPHGFNHQGIILPKFPRGKKLDGVTTSYQFPKGTLGNGDDQANLSQSMFGEDGLFPALHPGCNAWPEGSIVSHLRVLDALVPDSSALYVEEPVSHANDPPLNEPSFDTQGTLYAFDKHGATIFEEKLNKFPGSPGEAFFRLGMTVASRDGTTGTAVESEA
jgi:hypothetical protein